MHKRQFGKDNLYISDVGLGCWQLGGTDWGNLEESDAYDILHTAIKNGTSFFDTADVYGSGRSEELIGKFLRKMDDRPVVATKVGRFEGCGFPSDYTFGSIRNCTEASMRRLGVDSLDLTQLHCVPANVLRRGKIFEWLRQLKQEGKIQRFGASVETMEEALICLEQDGLHSLQIIFNIFRQKPIEFLFEKASAKKIAIIVRLPLASGLLGGKYTKETRFAPNDHRTYNRDGQAFNIGETFAGLEFELGVELANALKAYIPEGMTLPQMAIRWVLDYPEVTVVIPGARNIEQARLNAQISDLPHLPRELHEELHLFYEERAASHIRGPY